VLAHPSYVKDVESVLPGLIEAGLTGMEVYYRDYPEDLQAALASIARRFGIMPLGGSDYHGLNNPGEREPGNIPLPSRVAKDFLEKELPWVPTRALT
jgi:hypothetical protein